MKPRKKCVQVRGPGRCDHCGGQAEPIHCPERHHGFFCGVCCPVCVPRQAIPVFPVSGEFIPPALALAKLARKRRAA